MKTIKQNLPGILICLLIAVPSWLIGKKFPVIGGPVIAIIIGMLLALVWTVAIIGMLIKAFWITCPKCI